MPKWVVPTLLLLGSLALLPWAFLARTRVVHSPHPRLHLVQDMDDQGKFKTQQANPWFADLRAMRAPVAGTLPRGSLAQSEHERLGIVGSDYATQFPMPLSGELLERGRERYDIFCAPCHGLAGYGDGIVGRRAERLQQGSWVPPSSLHVEPAASRPVGHLFNTISNGIRQMPAYGEQIPVQDRWAIVAYVRALQRSQSATLDDVPPSERDGLR